MYFGLSWPEAVNRVKSQLAPRKKPLDPAKSDSDSSIAAYLEQKALFRSLADSSPSPISLYVEGHLVYSNLKAAKLLGFSNTESLLNRRFLDFIHPEDRNRFKNIFSQDQNSSGLKPTGKLRLLQLEGAPVHAEVTAIPLQIEKLPVWMIICRNVTDNKSDRDKVYSKATFMETLIDTVPNPIFFKDINGKYTGCNEYFGKKILGLSRDQILGRTLFDFPGVIPKDLAEIYFCQDEKLFKKPGTQIYESMARCADGVRRNFLFYKATFNDGMNQVAGLVGVMVDITELRQAENELESYQTLLRSLSSRLTITEEQERRKIAVSLHEQIGQVLTVSKMKLGELRQNLASEKMVESMDEIRMLIDKTIQETRKLTFELSPPILHELGLKAAIEWLGETIQEKHKLYIKVTDDGNSMFLDDAIRLLLFKGIRELLFNVVYHAKADTAQVTLTAEDQNIRIEVKDNGIGFDGDQKNALYRVPKGYGLFTIKERMNHLGGELKIESEPSNGSTITLVSPMVYPVK